MRPRNERDPDGQIALSVASRDASLAAVSVGEADVAITFAADRRGSLPPELKRTTLLEDPILVIVPGPARPWSNRVAPHAVASTTKEPSEEAPR